MTKPLTLLLISLAALSACKDNNAQCILGRNRNNEAIMYSISGNGDIKSADYACTQEQIDNFNLKFFGDTDE